MLVMRHSSFPLGLTKQKITEFLQFCVSTSTKICIIRSFKMVRKKDNIEQVCVKKRSNWVGCKMEMMTNRRANNSGLLSVISQLDFYYQLPYSFYNMPIAYKAISTRSVCSLENIS